MRQLFFLLFLVVSFAELSGQAPDSLPLNKKFKFRDGLYRSFAAFQQNQPDLSWVGLTASSVISEENLTIKVEWIRGRPENADSIDLAGLWGICVNGVPYIQVEKDRHEFAIFAALRVRGKICYYTFETKKTELVEIAAYNPLTGRAFRKAKLPRDKHVTQDMMLDFVSGKTAEFNTENFMDWVQEDDKALWRSLAELPEEEATEKLYKCLLIYDDRNPVYVR